MNIRKQYFNSLIFLLCLSILVAACNNDQPANKEPNRQAKDSLPGKESVNPYATHDQSPMDMCYFPPDYPLLKMNGTDSEALTARVIYSRPQKKGRNIFGDTEKSLRQYGKEWRLGANEATEIEFFKPVTIAGKKIEKGRYIIYCIPYQDKWTIILNSNLYTWGLHMDRSKDVFSTDIPVQQQFPVIEDFTMVFEVAPYGANLLMSWDNIKTILPIAFTK